MRRITPITTILLAVSAGCGDQAGPDYQGEPLAVLRGVLVSELTRPLPEVDIVLAWPDWSKSEQLDDGVTYTGASTFARLPVAAMLPARFSATLFEPPPETAYLPQSDALPRLVGPRYTSASILLARKGKEVTSGGYLALDLALANPNEAVLAGFNDYLLTYVESDGVWSVKLEDGTTVGAEPVAKGFHLVRQDRVVCALAYDEACIAQQIALGFPEETAWWGCVSTTETVTPVEVPLDTDITLTLKDPTVLEPRPPLCDTPPAG